MYAAAQQRTRGFRNRWQTAVRKESRIKGPLIGIAMTLSTYGDPKGFDQRPSAATLAQDTGHGVNRCREALVELHRLEYLFRYLPHSERLRKPAQWILTIPESAADRTRHSGPPMALDGEAS